MKKDLKNSIDFINKKVGKKSGFSITSNYFEDLEDAIFAKITTSELPKKTGFKTPENYFSEVENKILLRISENQHQPKVIDFKRKILKIVPYLVAASIVLFITINTFIFNKKESITFDSISKNDIENWFDSNTLNSSDIATILGDGILEMNDFYFAQFKTETIEDYLYSIDNQEILNEKD